MSYYIGESCYRVYGPIGRRKDGEWSRREVIWASFRFEDEAEKYMRDNKDCALRLERPLRANRRSAAGRSR